MTVEIGWGRRREMTVVTELPASGALSDALAPGIASLAWQASARGVNGLEVT